MTNLERRLRKLEDQVTGGSGLIPDSPEWLAFHFDIVDRILAGESVPAVTFHKPMAGVDAILRAHDEAVARGEYASCGDAVDQ